MMRLRTTKNRFTLSALTLGAARTLGESVQRCLFVGWRIGCTKAILMAAGIVCGSGMVCDTGMLGQSHAQSAKPVFDTIAEDRKGPLPGTEPLVHTGDIASDLVDGVDRFLLKQIDASVEGRMELWPKPDLKVQSGTAATDGDAYSAVTESLRQEYARRIGLVDTRVKPVSWSVRSRWQEASGQVGSTEVGVFEGIRIVEIQWKVQDGFDASGLMLIPKEPKFGAVVVPDAGETPEQLSGIVETKNPTALYLARCGGMVVVPNVVRRNREARLGRAVMTDQEYLYRSAFVLGRHLLGVHVHQNRSALDLLEQALGDKPLLVAGWGEGGWVALATGVVDTRVDVTVVCGHFGPKEKLWSEPIHRNVHGLLSRFGDAQLAALIAPRTLVIDGLAGPDVEIGGDGGAPGKLNGPTLYSSAQEVEKAQRLLKPWKLESAILLPSAYESPARRSQMVWEQALDRLGTVATQGRPLFDSSMRATPTDAFALLPSEEHRRAEILASIDRMQQRTLELAHLERDSYWKSLDTSSMARFQETVEPYRDEFRKEIIGGWDIPKKPLNARTRLVYDREKYRGYEVVLDVFDDVIAYGVLLVPKSDTPIQGRPCVVFQHGLEGRPTDTIVHDHPAYHDVAARLAEEGYVVFAPQNLYLFTDRFRTLQRKSNLLGKTLFSTIIAQHEQIVDFLGKREEIDPKRIAFYGLSYGGKSAMRIPALVPQYCLSICSADFNDWVWKNASTSSPYSYVWTMEYEIFEFDLGRKFNYAEMAALIAPRPFMVERGHFDGVAPDERVALEYAKVQRLYAARLGQPDKCRIEFFPGPHTIHGVGTFEFLRQHLQPEWVGRSR